MATAKAETSAEKIEIIPEEKFKEAVAGLQVRLKVEQTELVEVAVKIRKGFLDFISGEINGDQFDSLLEVWYDEHPWLGWNDAVTGGTFYNTLAALVQGKEVSKPDHLKVPGWTGRRPTRT